MNEPVLARDETPAWITVTVTALGLVGLVVAVAWAAAGGWFPAVTLGLAGAAAVVFCTVQWRWQRGRRLWVRDTGTGLVVTDRRGERAFADADVLTFALTHKPNYSQGLLVSRTRHFIVWLLADGATERLDMVNTIKDGAVDPLAGLIDRLDDRLFEQARHDLRAGRSVLGEGWSLERGQLTVDGRGRGEPFTCPLAEVTAAEPVAGRLCVWRRGVDETAVRLPLESANAHLLARLLSEEIAGRPGEETPAGGLGRIVFERRPAAATAAFLYLVAAVIGLVACALAVAAAGGRDASAATASGMCALVSVACVLGAVHVRRSAFRCHAHGVTKSGLFGTTTLYYADMQEFTYNAVRHFHHGVYTGTMTSFAFEPADPGKGGRISYSAHLRNADEELDQLRDRIARVLAGRMARQLAAGEPVPWTKHFRFLPGRGLEHRPRGWLRRKEPEVLPFGAIGGFNVDQATFQLWASGRPKPVIREAVSEANFFPGYFLLAALSAAPDGAAAREGVGPARGPEAGA